MPMCEPISESRWHAPRPGGSIPITPVLLGTHPCYGTRFSRISLVVEAPRQWRFRREDRAEFTWGK